MLEGCAACSGSRDRDLDLLGVEKDLLGGEKICSGCEKICSSVWGLRATRRGGLGSTRRRERGVWGLRPPGEGGLGSTLRSRRPLSGEEHTVLQVCNMRRPIARFDVKVYLGA